MQLTINTPALLFPAISLLMLYYGNRFVALANRVRILHDEYVNREKNKIILQQIKSLRRRINLIRYMQGLGVFCFLCCAVSMYFIYRHRENTAGFAFALSLISLIASLVISLIEIVKSTNAIEYELSDMEELEKSNFFSDLISKDDKSKG
jgi:hypothetical protein